MAERDAGEADLDELAADGAEFIASRGARLEVAHQPLDGGDELELEIGTRVVASVKATSVVIGLPKE